MKYRTLGRTGWSVSEVSFGAWAIGGAWGHVSHEDALASLHQAIDCGVNFIDTADVYGDGRSERLIAQLKRSRKDSIIVATKAGRRLPRQTVEGYSRQNLTSWVEDSLRNLSCDSIDLLQLHCPPTELYSRPEIFGLLDDLVKAGKIRYYGVSVEKVEEALKAIEFPNVQTVQIIFNCFRQRPARRSSRWQSRSRSAFWRVCRWPAVCSLASCAVIPPSPLTTTVTSIAMEKPSMWARLSRAWTTRSALRRSKESVGCCLPAFP